MKRLLLIGLILIIAAGAGLLAVWTYIGRSGTSEIEQWIGRQIVSIIESHINPRVSFEVLDYQAPRTVVIDNLALTAENQSIISVNRMLLELAEIPQKDRPIQIQRIELDQPSLNFRTVSGGGFAGWNNFVRPKVMQDLDSVPQGQRLSDVLVLREVSINHGQIIYDDISQPDEPMILPGINLVLNTAPLLDEPGWYKLAGTFKREPIFDVAVDGRINLDTALLDIKHLKLNAELSKEQYNTLPPTIQTFLRKYEIQGQMQVQIQGQVPLKQPSLTSGQLQADLQDVKVAFEDAVLPIERFDLLVNMADEIANIQYHSRLLGGSARGAASAKLVKEMPFDLDWQIDGVRLENAIRVVEHQQPKHAGRVKSRGQIAANLTNLPASLSGSGDLQIDKGRLMNLPVLSDLTALITKVRLGVDQKSNDRAKGAFEFQSDHLHISEMEIISAFIGLRGVGIIYYDSKLDINVKARVMEQLQKELSRLGDIGTIIGALSDKVVTYHVHGTISDPKVTVRPLGIGK